MKKSFTPQKPNLVILPSTGSEKRKKQSTLFSQPDYSRIVDSIVEENITDLLEKTDLEELSKS